VRPVSKIVSFDKEKKNNSLPWLTAKRNFCMTARFPLTLYKPSTFKPEKDIQRNETGSGCCLRMTTQRVFYYQWNTQISTCTLHMLNAHLDKIRHRSAFSLTQGSQTAAKHLIWEQTGGSSNWTTSSLCIHSQMLKKSS